MSFNNRTGVTIAKDVGKVGDLAGKKTNLEIEQAAQLAAAREVQQRIGSFRQMGTDDTTIDVAGWGQNIANNALNTIRDTQLRSMEVVNEGLGIARVADGHASSAAANARLVSNLPAAVNDIHSGKEAREIQISIQKEETHQGGIRDTSTRNAQELNQKTVAVVDAVKDAVQSIQNSTSL